MGRTSRSSDFEIDLVPCIGLLSILTTFLVATAVWNQLMTLQVDQAIQDPNAPPPPPMETPPPPPMTVHIRGDGVYIGRELATGSNLPKIEDAYDWTQVREIMEKDREELPSETQVVIVTDDGVEYQHMVAALDMSRELGYDKTLLGGGPAQASALPLPTGN